MLRQLALRLAFTLAPIRGGGMSEAMETSLLALIFNATPIPDIAADDQSSPATTLTYSLHTADPGETGTMTTSEADYTNYSRVTKARTTGGFTVTGDHVSPQSDVSFPKSTGAGTQITHFGIGTGVSNNLMFSGEITPPIDVASAGVTPVLTTATQITFGLGGSESIIDGFERPEYAAPGAFKSSVSRTILDGAVTGFVVKTTNPEDFDVTPTPLAIYKMVPTVTTTPSSDAVSVGTFYDALVPLVAGNRAGTLYIWVDVNAAGTYTMGSATAVVTVTGTLPAVPVKPMLMLMANSFLTLGHYAGYVGGSEALGIPYLDEMIAHRLHPYGSWVSVPPITGGLINLSSGSPYDFQSQALDYSPTRVLLPGYTTSGDLEAADASTVAEAWDAWFYSMDEPSLPGGLAALQALLANQKLYAPHVKRMVTTPFNEDLDDVDIYCPLANQFDAVWGETTMPGESAYAGKELWLYVSCISHGCGPDLAADPDVERVSGSDSGTPDLTMDRTAAEPFGFMLLGQKYPTVTSLLYYNTVEQYKLFSLVDLDMWEGETWNFGGNLDGTLFWPGRVGIEGLAAETPIVSVRMKLLREAQNLADLLSMLDPTWVATQVDAIMTSPVDWTRDISVFETLQRDAMAQLAPSLSLVDTGTDWDEVVTIESAGQFRLEFTAKDNWGLSSWFDLVNDPTATTNLIGPALGVGQEEPTIAEPGLFQEVFYGTDPDDPKLYMVSIYYYAPSTPKSFEILESTSSRVVVRATSQPVAGSQGVLTNITGVVTYYIYPDGRIYVHAELLSDGAQEIVQWRCHVGLQNTGVAGHSPPDTTGWIRASATENPITGGEQTQDYVFAYWTGSAWSKASVLMVPRTANPLTWVTENHTWINFLRLGFQTDDVSMGASDSIVCDWLIQLGSENSTVLPDIKTSAVAGPIASAYQSASLPS